MAFRYDGYNWEGRQWQTVPAIETLGLQIEEARRELGLRDTWATDGTVASRTHDQNSPTSHHRPDTAGDVRAIDIGGTADFLWMVAEAIRLSKDPRVVYVIYNGQIFSNYERDGIAPYTWRPYSGSNPHRNHVHVSVRRDTVGDDAPWDIGLETQEEEPMALTDYEQAAIDSLLEDGIFTEYTVDEEGEVHAEVKLKKLAVFLMRMTDKIERADKALADAIAAVEAGQAPDLTEYVKKGEEVTLV